LFVIATLLCAAPLSARVIEVVIGGIVQPLTVQIFSAALSQAEAQRADAVVLRLNIRGGLPASTRTLADGIRRSPVPVIVWLDPAGAPPTATAFALASSADVVAVSPGLQIPGIRMIATDTAVLLRTLNGREITRFNGRKQTLRLAADAVIDDFEPPLRMRILSAVAEPNIALALLVAGALSVYLEFSLPGLVLPGVFGVILIPTGLSALAIFPIGWPGACLAIAGLGLCMLEGVFTIRGVPTACGIAALLFGAMRLIDSNDAALRIHAGTAAAAALALAPITGFLFYTSARARRNKSVMRAVERNVSSTSLC
jgi:membrane-bound ClpP family serine protease